MIPTFNPPGKHTPLLPSKLILSLVFSGLLAACGGANDSAAPSAGTPLANTGPDLVLPDAVNASSPQALNVPAAGGVVAYFKQKLMDEAASSAQNGSPTGTFLMPAAAGPDQGPAGVVTNASSGAVEFAGSTLQERGVDEDDWVKTDGSLVYGLSRASHSLSGVANRAVLQAQRRMADGQLQQVGSVSLTSELTYSGMYLVAAAGRIALLGQKIDYSNIDLRPILPAPAAQPAVSSQPGTAALPADVARATIVPGISWLPAITTAIELLPTPATGAVTSTLSISNRIRIDGSLVGSRMIGSTLYVVSRWQPDLNDYLMPNATPAQTQAKLASLTAAEILPTIRIDGADAQPLVAESDCYVQTGNASRQRQITTITAFNLASSSLERSSRCFLGGSEALYMSPAAVYFASSRYIDYGGNIGVSMVRPANSKTDIHKFALAGQGIDYRGSGEVDGHFGWDADKNAYRMSEHNGDLRVVTFTGEQGWSLNRNGTSANISTAPAPSPAKLSVLRETPGTTASGNSLQVVATLPNAQRPAAIGKPGEQIYAVQFVGPKAYVVTFRRTDPLYVLDLSNPLEPKTVGELEIPGYSDYLYPLGDSLLLGVGKDANGGGFVQGIKVALMDVSDPAKPSILSSLILGKRGSASALDGSSRGINIFKQGDVFRVALPVTLMDETLEPIRQSSAAPYVFRATQGLARFEVDTKAKTLVTKPMLTSLTPGSPAHGFGQYVLAEERCVQIESFVYYLSGGSFRSANW